MLLQIPVESWCFSLSFVTALCLALPHRLSLSSPVAVHAAETLRERMIFSLQAQRRPGQSKDVIFLAAQPPCRTSQLSSVYTVDSECISSSTATQILKSIFATRSSSCEDCKTVMYSSMTSLISSLFSLA